MNPPIIAPLGTIYGTLLNFRREWDVYAPQMDKPPYKAPPQAPVLYVKTANTVSHNGQVPLPAHVPQIEVGASIALEIRGFSLVGHEKLDIKTIATKMAGWRLVNDFSIPHASYFRPPVKYKCLDGSLGVGAQRVAPVPMGEVATAVLQVHINGQWVQTVDFSQLIRDAVTLLRDVSGFMALQDGDLLMLGLDCLPGGGRPLARVGDEVQITSPTHPQLGGLTNTVVAAI